MNFDFYKTTIFENITIKSRYVLGSWQKFIFNYMKRTDSSLLKNTTQAHFSIFHKGIILKYKILLFAPSVLVRTQKNTLQHPEYKLRTERSP